MPAPKDSKKRELWKKNLSIAHKKVSERRKENAFKTFQELWKDKEARELIEARLPFRRASYGQIDASRGDWSYVKKEKWKMPDNRLAVYDKAWEYYLENEFARPIINLQASAIFGKGVQFIGDNEQVKFARELFSQIDKFQLGIESGIYGDNFIRIFQGKTLNEFAIAILPPRTVTKKVADDNVLKVEDYVQFEGKDNQETIKPEYMVHAMINAVSDCVYGASDLLHLFYHMDMYDSMMEEADKRRLFASQPIGKFTGIDTRYRTSLKARIKSVSRDTDSPKGLRRSFPPGSQLYLPTGVDYNLVESSGKFDLESILNRIAKIIAMASETPLHWMSLSEDVALKTAKESQWPFIKKINRRQEIFKRVFESLLKKVYDLSVDKNGKRLEPWVSEENREGEFQIQVVFPKIYDYELDEIEKGVKSTISTYQQGLISRKSALDEICKYFGLNVEVEEERLEKEAEKEEKAVESFTGREKAIGEIGNAVAEGELEKDTATKLITRILSKGESK